MDAIDLTLRSVKGSALTHAEMDNNLSALRTGTYNATVSFKNKLINGCFRLCQRGTSQTSSGYGSVDRWLNAHDECSKTASQQAFTLGQTEVPNNPKYFLRHVVTTSANAVNEHCIAYQRIEDVRTLAGQTATLSFYAKADSNKNISVELGQGFGTGGTPTADVNGIGITKLNLTTGWQKYTVTVNIPSIAGKTLGSDNNDYLFVGIWFTAGSNYDARTDSLGTQSGTFDIAQVQLEAGSVATDFEDRPKVMEESLCQRYFEVGQTGVYNTSIAPIKIGATYNYRVEKRDTPTIAGVDGIDNIDVISRTYVSARKYTSNGSWWSQSYRIDSEL